MSIFSDLKKFALRGNLVDMAVGFTVGAAFTSIAKSLVSDIIMPPVGMAIGGADFSNLFLVLRRPEGNTTVYNTVAEANSAGLVTINYGLFLNNLISFALITLVMFFLIRVMNQLEDRLELPFGKSSKPDEPTEKKCPYCVSTIAYKATRCPNCTSELSANPA